MTITVDEKSQSIAVKFPYFNRHYGNVLPMKEGDHGNSFEAGMNEAKRIIDGLLAGRKNEAKHE